MAALGLEGERKEVPMGQAFGKGAGARGRDPREGLAPIHTQAEGEGCSSGVRSHRRR